MSNQQGNQPNQANQAFNDLFGLGANPQSQPPQTGLGAAQQSLLNQAQGANTSPASAQANPPQQGFNMFLQQQPSGQAQQPALDKQFSFSNQLQEQKDNARAQEQNNIINPPQQAPIQDQQKQDQQRQGINMFQPQSQQNPPAPGNFLGLNSGNLLGNQSQGQSPFGQANLQGTGNQQGAPQGQQNPLAQAQGQSNPLFSGNLANLIGNSSGSPFGIQQGQQQGQPQAQESAGNLGVLGNFGNLLGKLEDNKQGQQNQPAQGSVQPNFLINPSGNQQGQQQQGQQKQGNQFGQGLLGLNTNAQQQQPQPPIQMFAPQQANNPKPEQKQQQDPQQATQQGFQLGQNQIKPPQAAPDPQQGNDLSGNAQKKQQKQQEGQQQVGLAQQNTTGQNLGFMNLGAQFQQPQQQPQQQPLQQNQALLPAQQQPQQNPIQNTFNNQLLNPQNAQQNPLQNLTPNPLLQTAPLTQSIPSGQPTQAQQAQQVQAQSAQQAQQTQQAQQQQQKFTVPQQKTLRPQAQGALAQQPAKQDNQSSEDDFREKIVTSQQYQQEQQKWKEFYQQQKQNFLQQVKANIQGDGSLTYPDTRDILRIVSKDEVDELKKCLKDNPSVYRRLLYGPRWYSLEIGEFQSELNNIGYLRSRAFSNKIPDWAFEAIKQSLDESTKKKLEQDYYSQLPQDLRQQAYLQLIYDTYVHYCDQRAKLAEAQYYLIASGLQECGTVIKPLAQSKNFIYDQFFKHTQFYDCLYTNYMEQKEVVNLFNSKIYKQGELEQYGSSDDSDNELGTSYERVVLAVGREQKWTLQSLYLLQFYYRDEISYINNFFKYYIRQYVHQTILIVQRGIFFQIEALTNKKKQGGQLKAQIGFLSEALVLGYSKKTISSSEYLYPQDQFNQDLIIEEQFIDKTKLSIYFLQKILFVEKFGQAHQSVYGKKLTHIYKHTMGLLEYLCKGIKKYFTQTEIHFAIEQFILMVVLASFKNIEKLAIKQEKIAQDILAIEHVLKEVLDSKLVSSMFEKQYESKVPEMMAVFNACRRRHIMLQKYKLCSLKLINKDSQFLIYVFSQLDQLSTDQKLQFIVNKQKSKAKSQRFTENSMSLYTTDNKEQAEEEIQHSEQIRKMLKLYREIKDIIKYIANQATVDPEFIEKMTKEYVKQLGKEETQYIYLYRAITTLLNDASEKISPKFHHISFEDMHKIVLSISYHCLQIFKALISNYNTYLIMIQLIDSEAAFDERRNCLIRVQYSCKSLEQAKMYPYPQICSIQQQTMQILQQFLLHDYIYSDLKIKTQESIQMNFFDQLLSFYTTQLLADWASYDKFQNAKMYPLWKEMIYTLNLILGKFVFNRYDGYQETYLHETMLSYLNQIDSVVILDLINTQLEVEVTRTFLNNTTNHIFDDKIREKIGVSNRLLGRAQDSREQEYITGIIIRTIQLCSTLMDLVALQKPINILLIVKDFNEYLNGTSNLRYRRVFMPSQIEQNSPEKFQLNMEVSIQLDISHYMLAILKIIDDQYELEWINMDQKGYEWLEEYDNQLRQNNRLKFIDCKPFLSRNQPKKMTLFQSAIRLLTKFNDLESRLTKISYIEANNHTYTRSLSYKQFIFQLLQLIIAKLTHNENDEESIDIIEFFIVQTIRKQQYMEYLFVKSSVDSKAIQQENVRRFLFSFQRRSNRSMRYDLVTLMYFNLILNETNYCHKLREQCRSEFSGQFIERIIAPICLQLEVPLRQQQQAYRIEQQKFFVQQQIQQRELNRIKQYEEKQMSEIEIKYQEVQRKLNELQIDKQKLKNLQSTICMSQQEYEQEYQKIQRKEKLFQDQLGEIRVKCEQNQRQQQILESKIRESKITSQQRTSKLSEQSDLLGSNVRQVSNIFTKQQEPQQSILKKSSYENRQSVVLDEQDDVISIQSFYDLYKETKPNQLELSYLEQTILEYTYEVATLEQLLIFLQNESKYQISCNSLIDNMLNKSVILQWLALLIEYSNTEFYNNQYYNEYKEAYSRESKFKFQNQIAKMDYLQANFFSFGRDYGHDTIAIFYNDIGMSNEEDYPFIIDKLIKNQRLNLLHSWFTIMRKTLAQIEKFTLYTLSFSCNKPFTYNRLYSESRDRFITQTKDSLQASKDEFNQFVSKTTALLSPNDHYKLMRQSTRYDAQTLVGYVGKILNDVRYKFFNAKTTQDDAPPEFIDPQLLIIGHFLSAIHIQQLEPSQLNEVQQHLEAHLYMLRPCFNYNKTTVKIILNNLFKNLQLIDKPKTIDVPPNDLRNLLKVIDSDKHRDLKKDIAVIVKLTEILQLIMFKLRIGVDFDNLRPLLVLQNEFMREKQHNYQYTGIITQFWGNLSYSDKQCHQYLVESLRTINTLGRQIDFQNLTDYDSYKFIMWNYTLIYLRHILDKISIKQILDFVEIHFNRIQETIIFEDVNLKGLQYTLDKKSQPKYMRLFEVNNILKLFVKLLLKSDDALREGYTQMIDKIIYFFLNIIPQGFGQYIKVQQFLKSFTPKGSLEHKLQSFGRQTEEKQEQDQQQQIQDSSLRRNQFQNSIMSISNTSYKPEQTLNRITSFQLLIIIEQIFVQRYQIQGTIMSFSKYKINRSYKYEESFISDFQKNILNYLRFNLDLYVQIKNNKSLDWPKGIIRLLYQNFDFLCHTGKLFTQFDQAELSDEVVVNFIYGLQAISNFLRIKHSLNYIIRVQDIKNNNETFIRDASIIIEKFNQSANLPDATLNSIYKLNMKSSESSETYWRLWQQKLKKEIDQLDKLN